MKKITITKVYQGNGWTNYTYNTDMKQVTDVEYMTDMSYAIGLTDDQSLPDATQSEIDVVRAARVPVEPIPDAVTKRQARQQLLIAGLLPSVQPAIDSIPDPTERALAQIYWDDSQEYERNHPMLTTLAKTLLGMTDQQLDDLFKEASKL